MHVGIGDKKSKTEAIFFLQEKIFKLDKILQ